MNKNNIRLIITLTVASLPAAINAHYVSDLASKIHSTLNNNRKAVVATGVVSGTALLAYAQREAVKRMVTTTKEKATDLAQRAGLSAMNKWLDCKEWYHDFKLNKAELNISYADVIAVTAATGTLVGTAYGLKKLDNKYDIVNKTATISRNGLLALPSFTKTNVIKAWDYSRIHKKEIAAVAAGLAAAYVLWQFGKSINADRKQSLTTMDAFLSRLTPEQLVEIGKSSDLVQLVGQAQDNPEYLLKKSEFTILLSDQQKNILERIVTNHKKSMALLRAAY